MEMMPGIFRAHARLLRRRLNFIEPFRGDPGQFADYVACLRGLSDENLEGALSGEKPNIEAMLREAFPSGLIRVLIDQSARWSKELAQRANLHRSLLGVVLNTHELGGDPHLSGVPVLLETDKGLFVYKPRSLEIDRAYSRIVHQLRECGAACLPNVQEYHCFGEYGFSTYAESRPSPVRLSELDFETIGAGLALVYLLSGSDFHYENIVFTDNGPSLIDMEGLLQPVLATAVSGKSPDTLSVLNTGILPAWVGEAESPLGFDPSVIGSGRYIFDVSHERALEQFRCGFLSTYLTILSNAPDIASSEEFVQLRNTRSRLLAAQTIDYIRAIARHIASIESITTDLRSRFLDELRSSDGVEDCFIAHERVAIEQMCVPIFYSANAERQIFDELGNRIDARIVANGYENAGRRLSGLSPKDAKRQLWFIDCSFEYHALNAHRSFLHIDRELERVDPSPEALLTAISALRDDLLSSLKPGGRGEVYAVVPVLEAGQWRLKNRRLSKGETRILRKLSGVVDDLVHTKLPEARDSQRRKIRDHVVEIASALQGLEERDFVESKIQSWVHVADANHVDIFVTRGICCSILSIASQAGDAKLVEMRECINRLRRGAIEGKLRFGGVFSTRCLYFGFGVPALLLSLCAAAEYLLRNRLTNDGVGL